MRANQIYQKIASYAFIGLILIPCWGCSSGRHSQREMALLRAEILDLEDQYYALKARCEGAESQLRAINGTGVGPAQDIIYEDQNFDCHETPAYMARIKSQL